MKSEPDIRETASGKNVNRHQFRTLNYLYRLAFGR